MLRLNNFASTYFELSWLPSLLFGVVVCKLSAFVLLSLCVWLPSGSGGIFGICGIVALGNGTDDGGGHNSFVLPLIINLFSWALLQFVAIHKQITVQHIAITSQINVSITEKL